MLKKLLKKLAFAVFETENGALYMLKILSILAIFQMLYSVSFFPQNHTATVEIFGGGCMTGTLAVVGCYLADKLKNFRKK